MYSNQYNEFVRLVFKNQKSTGTNQKMFNVFYVMGLGKALGLNLKKDSFSEQNLKSREHLNTLKEKLIFCMWRKLNEENKEILLPLEQTKNNNNDSSEELDGGNSFDSTIASSNTPKSKNLGINSISAKMEQEITSNNENNKSNNTNVVAQSNSNAAGAIIPHQNVMYKYFIGKGNNSIMVRSLFKNRYWWVQGESIDDNKINFSWTQTKV